MTAERHLYDDDLAAARLDLVARLFEPSTARFLDRRGRHGANDAIDRQGSALFAGPFVAGAAAPAGTVAVANDTTAFDVSPPDAGRMFGINLRVLRHDGVLPRRDAGLDELQASLDRAVAGEARPGCVLHQRQVVYRAT